MGFSPLHGGSSGAFPSPCTKEAIRSNNTVSITSWEDFWELYIQKSPTHNLSEEGGGEKKWEIHTHVHENSSLNADSALSRSLRGLPDTSGVPSSLFLFIKLCYLAHHFSVSCLHLVRRRAPLSSWSPVTALSPKAGPHQTLNLLPPWSSASQPPPKCALLVS